MRYAHESSRNDTLMRDTFLHYFYKFLDHAVVIEIVRHQHKLSIMFLGDSFNSER